MTGSEPAPSLRRSARWHRWLVAASLSRLTTTMLPVALVLTAHDHTGSFVGSGLLSGSSAMTSALVAPLRGRQLDRQPLPRAAGVSLLLAALALSALTVAAALGAPLFVLLVLTVVASACSAGVGGAYRALLVGFVRPDELAGAYAIDAVAVQLVWIGGPALAGLTAAVGGSTTALGAATLVAAGAAGLSWTLPRREPVVRPGRRQEPALIGLLRVPLLLNVGIGINLGALDVALPALLGAHGRNPAGGGPLLAAIFTASILSGIGYALLPPSHLLRRAPTRVRAAVLITGYGALTLVGAVSPGLWLAAGFLVVSGLALAPGDSAALLLVPEQVADDRQAEAFGYFSSFGFLGSAVAGAATGSLVTGHGVHSGLLLAGLGPLLAGLIALPRHRGPRPGPDAPGLSGSRTRGPADDVAAVNEL